MDRLRPSYRGMGEEKGKGGRRARREGGGRGARKEAGGRGADCARAIVRKYRRGVR